MITIKAPAKINLTLEVLGKRPDGFHEIRSIIQTINLCDRLSFQVSDTFEFQSKSSGWAADKSLVSRAANLLRETSGRISGAVITVEKHIPLVSGLGGDSSDAAAVLKGLSLTWQLNLPQGKLKEIGSRLGSDVAFFINGGTALMEGRGEIVSILPPLSRWWCVLVIPAIPRMPDKTRLLYESLNDSHYTNGQHTLLLAQNLNERKGFLPDLIFNVFEKTAFSIFPGLSACKDSMLESGSPCVHLAGSGPTLFSLLDDETEANQLYRRLNDRGLETLLTETFTPAQG